MEHESSVDLQFLKNTGDGFLAVYRTMTHAFSIGWDFLNTTPCAWLCTGV